jgi:hypothetical protein
LATSKEAEAAKDGRLAAAVTGDADKDRQLRAVYAGEQQIASVEAVAYRDHCSCVYAAVVRATPAVLQMIAQREEVRSVDPAPAVRRLDRAVFLPPLPEQNGQAGPPDGPSTPPASPTGPPR